MVAHLVSYMPRESSPTMEDFGEGQLVNGTVAVRIDSAFANAIDQSKDYLVFLTPDGDTKGLYVAPALAQRICSPREPGRPFERAVQLSHRS